MGIVENERNSERKTNEKGEFAWKTFALIGNKTKSM